MRKRWHLGIFLSLFIAGMLFCPDAYGFPSPDRIKVKKQSTLLRAPLNPPTEEYNAEKAAVLSVKRKALIEDIKRFIREAHDAEQAAELNLRLGALYMEDYYSNMAKAQKEYDEARAQWEKRKKGKEPVLDLSESKSSLSRARTVYKDLVRRFAKHPRRDEIIYFLAVSSLDANRITEAMNYFRQITDLPKSKYHNEALVQLADHSFEKNKFKLAENYYDRLIARKHTPLLAYATYKKGWCAYNREAYAETIKQFKWVISFADADADNSTLRIRQEAIRDIALPFSALKATDEAMEFYASLGMPHHRNGLESLATIFHEKGLHEQSVALNERLLEMDRNHPKNAQVEIQIIDALNLMHKEVAATERLFNALVTYTTDSHWYELNSSNASVVQTAKKEYEELTRNYALRYHSVAQKTKNDTLYDRAKLIYAKYVEHFPNTEHTSKIRFYLAEILYKQKQFIVASEHYYRVYEDKSSGKLRPDAIRYALAALDQQLNLDRKNAGLAVISTKSTSKLKSSLEDSHKPIAFSPVETRFMAIGDEYLKHYPSAKDANEVLYEQSYLKYSHHEFKDSYKGFWNLIQKYPSHSTAVSSAHLLLDILNRMGDYSKLVAACQKFLTTPQFNNPSFRAEVAGILRKAELKRISLLEEKKQFKEAADSYVEYAKSYGGQDDGLHETALFNASVNYSKASLPLLAAETQEKFLRRFPQSRHRESLLLQVAKTYETLAHFDKSGKYFEEFANRYPSNAQAKNALRLAGLYLGGTGHLERAEAIFARFGRMYPSEAKTVERDLLTLYESTGDVEKQFQFYLKARAGRVSLADYLAYTMAAAELAASKSRKLPPGLMDEARRLADKHAGEIRKSPKGVEALAKVRFWWVSQRDGLLRNYKLALPQSRLEANLKRKLLLLQELEREYGRIASLGNAEWGLAALYKTGNVYRHMAESVLTAPVPEELNAQALDNYRAELKRQMIDPFNEKARHYAATCLDKAQEHNVLSPWTAQCYRLLSEVQPERFPPVRTFYLPSMIVSVPLPPKNAKTETGGLKRFAYPFYSSTLFTPNRQLASISPIEMPFLYDTSERADKRTQAPTATSYEVLTTERHSILKNNYESEKPDRREDPTYSFLNLMRLVSAPRAVPLIESAIEKDPENSSLVNLLGLAYLEAGKGHQANVCWLSLVARGLATASVWNNLGVSANRDGNESQAISYFQEAIKHPGAKEAFINLGFIALKYRNGHEARNLFKKALGQDDDDVSAQAGLAVAYLQNREIDNAKELLVDLSRRHGKDPYLKLSLGYYLIDVEKETKGAQKLIQDYMVSQSLEKDMVFRRLLLEARRRPGALGEAEIPEVE